MTSKYIHAKVNDEVHKAVRRKLMDLTFRVHSICEFNPQIISILLYELVNDANHANESYIPNDEEILKTFVKIEKMLDEFEKLSNESRH